MIIDDQSSSSSSLASAFSPEWQHNVDKCPWRVNVVFPRQGSQPMPIRMALAVGNAATTARSLRKIHTLSISANHPPASTTAANSAQTSWSALPLLLACPTCSTIHSNRCYCGSVAALLERSRERGATSLSTRWVKRSEGGGRSSGRGGRGYVVQSK